MNESTTRVELKVIAVSAEARAERFAYTCGRCFNCCRNNDIQVNPYEIGRLAGRLGLSTTETIALYTRDGLGTLLTQRDNGDCVFLDDNGCSVYTDRPLVCWLYPLGRNVEADETEWFEHIE